MLRILPFDPAHARGARAHPAHAPHQHLLDDPTVIQMTCPAAMYSVLDGEDLVALGVVHDVDGGSAGWLLFTDKMAPRHFMPLYRASRRIIRAANEKGSPIIAHFDAENPEAMRWARLLGMKPSGFDRMPDGRRLERMSAC